jgi:adenylate cyclase
MALLAMDSPAVRRLEATTLDWRFHLRGPVAPGPEVTLILLDEPSLEALGGWPPSRRHMADAVERLHAAGARTVVLDLLFGARAHAEPDGDAAFAAAVREAGNVVLGYAFAFEAQAFGTAVERPPMGAALQRYLLPPGAVSKVPQATDAVLPPDPLIEAAAALGHMSVLLAPDGALRHEQLLVAQAREFWPSVAVQAARRFLGLPPSEVTAEIGERLVIGRRNFATDSRMRLPVNFLGPSARGAIGGIPTFSFAELLDGRVPDSRLQGRLVVVGGAEIAAGPEFVTPFDAALPPAAYTATVLDNLLTGRALARPDWLRGLELLAAVVGAVLAYGVARRVPAPAAPLAALVPAAAWTGLTILAFGAWQVWLAVVVPVAAIVVAANLGALARSRAEQRRREVVARERENLSRYFSPAVAERLAHRRDAQELAGVQDATVLFLDIVGFTGLCEKLPGERAIALLRGFHARVERAVFAQGGTLDKYLGDGAMAVFGVPEPQPDEAARALAAAVALQDSIAAWGAQLEAEGLPRLRLAVGLHHGPVLMGDIGGESRFEFTVLGDTVNVASRLEGLTRDLDAAIVASEATIERARATGRIPLGFARHGEVGLRGRDGRLAVWIWRPHTAERTERLAAG